MNKFIKEIFTDPDGTYSLGKVATGLLVIVAIVWVSFIIKKTDAFPDFSGLSLFVCTLYGLNHFGNSLNTFVTNKLPNGNSVMDKDKK